MKFMFFPNYKSGHIYLEILVGLVWPRVFVCPPPPSKLGAQPFPIFFFILRFSPHPFNFGGGRAEQLPRNTTQQLSRKM